jgi:hypothetical protein
MPLALGRGVVDAELAVRLPQESMTHGIRSMLKMCLQTVSSCHCEELKATKQSRFRAEIASLHSQ